VLLVLFGLGCVVLLVVFFWFEVLLFLVAGEGDVYWWLFGGSFWRVWLGMCLDIGGFWVGVVVSCFWFFLSDLFCVS